MSRRAAFLGACLAIAGLGVATGSAFRGPDAATYLGALLLLSAVVVALAQQTLP